MFSHPLKSKSAQQNSIGGASRSAFVFITPLQQGNESLSLLGFFVGHLVAMGIVTCTVV